MYVINTTQNKERHGSNIHTQRQTNVIVTTHKNTHTSKSQVGESFFTLNMQRSELGSMLVLESAAEMQSTPCHLKVAEGCTPSAEQAKVINSGSPGSIAEVTSTTSGPSESKRNTVKSN
jgi:hypothetical protein